MNKIYELLIFRLLSSIILSAALMFGCSSPKNDDPVTPASSIIPGAPEKFRNPEGYMTVEVNGKLIEIGVSISNSQLRASPVNENSYQIYAAVDVPNEGIHTINIEIITKDEAADVSLLKGFHKSNASISYELTTNNNLSIPDYRIFKDRWSTRNNCTVEITSTAAPWIEGDFSVDGEISLSYGNGQKTAKGPITIKKGKFKIRYQK